MKQKDDTTIDVPGPGPRGLMGIIAELFRLYGRNAPVMIGISSLLAVPLLVAGVAAFGMEFMVMLVGGSLEQPLPTLSGGALLGVAAYGALYTVGLLAASGALAHAGAKGLVGGAVSVGGSYEALLKRLPSMLGASIFGGLAAGAPLALGGLLATGGGVADYLLAVPLVLVGVYLAVRLMFSPLVALFEHTGPLHAIARSWRLVSGFWTRTFVVLLVMSLLLSAIEMPVLWLTASMPGVEAVLFALFMVPLTALGNLLIYLDIRVRKDGFMTEHLTAELDSLGGS
ncbi:MAG: hypothetical protein JW846_05555 [Dehalococcoidia bacterium]|nr:hypothetical protein [Dehalococcoidia bacterium]